MNAASSAFFFSRIVLALMIWIVACKGDAQNVASTAALKQNEMTVLKDFEPPSNEAYELGRGDEISINVLGRPELSSKHIVGPDGRVTLPLIGDIMLADKTREQASKAIEEALSPYYTTQVAVSVAVDHYTSNHVLLLGAVEHPGMMSFDKTPTLLEVISRGGVPSQPSVVTANSPSESNASQGPLVLPETCVIYRGSQTMVTVQLRSLLEEGSPLANMRLKRDDIVYVPGRDRYVSMLGQLSHPGTLHLSSTSTLPQLLAEAGGPTERAGRYPTIYIIHRSINKTSGKVTTVSYKDILTPKALDLTLMSGDIIYIPETGFNRAADLIQKVSPLIYLVTVASVL